MRYWQGVLKAMISHTIHRSMTLGDLLAIRGLPNVRSNKTSKYMLLLSCGWLSLGLVFLAVNHVMILIWSLMTIWIGLVSIARKTAA
jgi:cellulose synthase/poly-beta-1,6-N-acetylglucosamine synthase-like glycosyltransferase